MLRKQVRKQRPPARIAIGYMLMSLVPPGAVMDLERPMAAKAAGLGCEWGRAYLHHTSCHDTAAAVVRAVTLNEAIAVVLVPSSAHLPDGKDNPATGRGPIPVVTVDDEG